jgi:Acetyltransferase (GNAT) domain
MLKFERITYDPVSWELTLERLPNRTLYQSPAWLAFLAETQRGEVILAALRDGSSTVGYFTGLKLRRFGFSLLGSPLPGWTTSYMGFNLQPGVPVTEAIRALREFAFRELGCVHLEVMDRQLASNEIDGQTLYRDYDGFEIDLSSSEDTLFGRLHPPCRTCIRKAVRCGVSVEQASDDEFAFEYYAQLEDVFAKQGLRPTYSIDRVRALLRHLQPTGQLLLLRARNSEGRTIATGIFPAMYDRAYFWGAASWRSSQISRPNELIMWQAMLYWKSRGIQSFDMGGSGDYKRKYGGREISIPWVRMSRNSVMPVMRQAVAMSVKARQRIGALWPFGARQLQISVR